MNEVKLPTKKTKSSSTMCSPKKAETASLELLINKIEELELDRNKESTALRPDRNPKMMTSNLNKELRPKPKLSNLESSKIKLKPETLGTSLPVSSKPSTSNKPSTPGLKLSTSSAPSMSKPKTSTLSVPSTSQPGPNFLNVPSAAVSNPNTLSVPSGHQLKPSVLRVQTISQPKPSESEKSKPKPSTISKSQTGQSRSSTLSEPSQARPVLDTTSKQPKAQSRPSILSAPSTSRCDPGRSIKTDADQRIQQSVRDKCELDSIEREETSGLLTDLDTDPKGKTTKCGGLRFCFSGLSVTNKKMERKTFVEYLNERSSLKKTLLKDASYRRLYDQALTVKSKDRKKFKRRKNPYRLPIVTRTRRCNTTTAPKAPSISLPMKEILKGAENPEARKRLLLGSQGSRTPLCGKSPSEPLAQTCMGKRTLPAAEQQIAFRRVQGLAVQAHLAEVFALNRGQTTEDAKKNKRKRRKKPISSVLIDYLRNDLIEGSREMFSHLNCTRTISPVLEEKELNNEYEETSFIGNEHNIMCSKTLYSVIPADEELLSSPEDWL